MPVDAHKVKWISSWENVSRLVGMVAGAVAGISVAMTIVFHVLYIAPSFVNLTVVGSTGMAVGVVAGYFAAPICSIYMAEALSSQLISKPLPELVGGVIGTLIGLAIALLLGGLCSLLVGNLAWVIGLAFASVGVSTGWKVGTHHPALQTMRMAPTSSRVVLDTSFIIDPRCHPVLEAGLGAGLVMVPQGVMDELQQLADLPPDNPRSARGKHGLQTVKQLQAAFGGRFQVVDDPSHGRDPVDNQVLRVAQQAGGMVMTVDGNLTTVASVANVPVCNPNTLLKACQHVWQVGDEISALIEQTGRKLGQGVAHASDGTIVIVENAGGLVGSSQQLRVRRVQPTNSGAVIFAELIHPSGSRRVSPRRQNNRLRPSAGR